MRTKDKNMMRGAEDLPEEMYEESHRESLVQILKNADAEIAQAQLVVDSIDDMLEFWEEDGPDHFLDWKEWNNDMAGFNLLEELRIQDKLSNSQKARFEKVKGGLLSKRNKMKQMELSEPDFWNIPEAIQ